MQIDHSFSIPLMILVSVFLVLILPLLSHARPTEPIHDQISKRAGDSPLASHAFQSHPLGSSLNTASSFDDLSELDTASSSRSAVPVRSWLNVAKGNRFPELLLEASLEQDGHRLSEMLSRPNLVQWTGSSGVGYAMDATAFDTALSQMLHVFGDERIGKNGDHLVEFVLEQREGILASSRATSILDSAFLWSMSRPHFLRQFLQDRHLYSKISPENLGTVLVFAASEGRMEVVQMFLEKEHLLQRLRGHDTSIAILSAKTNSHLDIVKRMLENPQVVARMSPETLKNTWMAFFYDPKAFSLFLDIPHIKAALTPETLGSVFSLITLFDKWRLVQIYLSHPDIVERTPRKTIVSTIFRAVANDKNELALILLKNEAFHLSLTRNEYSELVDMTARKEDSRVFDAIKKILHDNPRPIPLPLPESLDLIHHLKPPRI